MTPLKKVDTIINHYTFDEQGNEVEKQISIVCTLFLGRNLLNLTSRLIKILVPYLRIISGLEFKELTSLKDIKDINLTPEAVDSLINNLLQSFDENKIQTLILDLVKNTEVDNVSLSRPELFDIVFQGDLKLLFYVLKFIITENFTPFFKGKLSQAMEAAIAKI